VSAKRILIIDDETAIQAVVSLALKMEAGWEVLTASSGKEGIERAIAARPDAILLDVMMPDLDGIATFEQLQGDPQTQAIFVIFLTAKARSRNQPLFEAMGVTGAIAKPFNSLTLAQQITDLLNWEL